MSDQDAFEGILASLYDAMLDETQWPATSALIDEACGMHGNALLVGQGPKEAVRVFCAGFYYRGQRREDGSASGSESTTLSTNAYRVSGNCPTAA